jgi:myo-inositol 2-dehydrogenase/D-chiro-inositol 1-dehydrogenase
MVQSRLKPTREVSLYSGTKVISDGLYPTWIERLAPSFALALDAFICTVEGQKVAYPTLMDGLRAQIIAEAALESLHTNQPVPITYWHPEK